MNEMTNESKIGREVNNMVEIEIAKKEKKQRMKMEDKMYVSFEFEFDNKEGAVTPNAKSLPKVDGKYGIFYTYEDGSVNSEWVSDPIPVNKPQDLRHFLNVYCSAIKKLNNGSRTNNASCHTTFTLSPDRTVPFPQTKQAIQKVIQRYYGALIWYSNSSNYTRGCYFRKYPEFQNDIRSKGNYPAVIFPAYGDRSSVTRKDMPPFHKIEFRIPDTFYVYPEWAMVLVDIYKAIILTPSSFLQHTKKTNEYMNMMHQSLSLLESDGTYHYSQFSDFMRKVMSKEIVEFTGLLLNVPAIRQHLSPTTITVIEKLFSVIDYSFNAKKYEYLPKNELTENDVKLVNQIVSIGEEGIDYHSDEEEDDDCVECRECGVDISRDESFMHNGRYFCSSSCREAYDNVFFCDDCSDEFEYSTHRDYDGNVLCLSCYNERIAENETAEHIYFGSSPVECPCDACSTERQRLADEQITQLANSEIPPIESTTQRRIIIASTPLRPTDLYTELRREEERRENENNN